MRGSAILRVIYIAFFQRELGSGATICPILRRVTPPKRPPPLPSWFPPPSNPVFLHTLAVLAVITPTIVTFRVLVIIILLVVKAKCVISLVPVEAVVVVVLVGAEASSEPSRGGQLTDQVGSGIGDHASPCQGKGYGIDIGAIEEHVVLRFLGSGQIVAVI